MKSGNLNLLEPSETHRASNGTPFTSRSKKIRFLLKKTNFLGKKTERALVPKQNLQKQNYRI